MTDPFESLREPVTPVDPDPDFAGRLRGRLNRAVFATQGGTMPQQTAAVQVEREPAWPPALTPYIVVSDARRAIDWYVEVFGAQRRGEPHVNSDGTIGHAEVGLGDAVLMLSEPSGLWPNVPVRAPDSPATFSHSLHLDVDDVDGATERARRGGAAVEREPADQRYGRGSVIVDPFGHRWMLLRPPARATRLRQGDVANVTMMAPDPERAKEFYTAVLQVPFSSGHPGRGAPRRPGRRSASSRRAAPSRRCSSPTALTTSRPRSSGSGRPAAARTSPSAGRSGCSPTASTTRARRSGSGSRLTDRSARSSGGSQQHQRRRPGHAGLSGRPGSRRRGPPRAACAVPRRTRACASRVPGRPA